MKTLLSLALILTVSLPASFAASVPASPSSDYAKAVKSYVEAAANDLAAVRTGLEEDAKNPVASGAKAAGEVSVALQRCEKLLADLKKAGPSEFDRVKAEYEKARVALGKQLDAARRS